MAPHGEGGQKDATKSSTSIHQTLHQSYAARSSFARRSLDTPWRLNKVQHFGGLNRTEERFKDLTKSADTKPSPASYRIQRFGDKINMQIPTASFNSTTRRFNKKENDYPTAVSYFHPSQQSKPTCESPNQDKLPECPDMSKKQGTRCTHAMTYDGSLTLANQSMREAQATQTLKGAFGTNCKRDLKLLKYMGTGSQSPGPGTYDPGKWHPEPVTVNGNSVFTSRSHRIGLISNDKQSFPAPADYGIDNYSIKRNIRVRRGRKMNRAFCSSIAREKAEQLADKKAPYSPGPAAYTVKKDVAEAVEMMPITLGCRTQRFEHKDNGVPPSTCYELPAHVMNTLYRRSYNVMLNDSTPLTNYKKPKCLIDRWSLGLTSA